jgi:hypothetical protein
VDEFPEVNELTALETDNFNFLLFAIPDAEPDYDWSVFVSPTLGLVTVGNGNTPSHDCFSCW